MSVADNIRAATWDDEKSIGATAILAFAADPFVRWIHPDPRNFIAASEKYPGLSAGPAFDNNSAYVTSDLCGFALWLPPGVKVDRRPIAAFTRPKMDPAVVDRFDSLLEKAGTYRPAEPHWYLSLIAVDPSKRGLGYGTALMQHALAVCDRDGLPAYLESTNEANLTLYKRHGFTVLAEVRVEGSPVRYPMLRRPR